MTTLREFLDQMRAKFAADFDSFEVYQYQGTLAELQPALAAWNRPASTRVSELDVAIVCAEASNQDAARSLVEAELKRSGEAAGKSLTVVSGLHVLATLYPGGLLQPLNQWLRKGSRVVVLAAPILQAVRLPEQVSLIDWRTSLLAALGPERRITQGGV
jgi:hypothetical protein